MQGSGMFMNNVVDFVSVENFDVDVDAVSFRRFCTNVRLTTEEHTIYSS